MDAKKRMDARGRLLSEYNNLIESLNRNRRAVAETRLEHTEDEGDLATISHERELLHNLRESDFTRFRFIQQAIKAIDRGQYGECVRCGEGINEKRLTAIPWTTLCIQCQEETERESSTPSTMVIAGLEPEETGF